MSQPATMPGKAAQNCQHLALAVLGTQRLASFLAVYGVFMAPLGWGRALLIRLYCLVWFLVEDRVKLVTHALLQRTRPAART